ncbi:MAG: hypothetical protein FJX74_14985 [Armatimonadetes bacterium]|nr:hypothetical protein [Armatimonadota bacterium]
MGFAHGWLRGELRRPEMSLDVALFGAGVDDLTVEALTAAVEATPERVAAEGLLARRGTAVLSGSAGLDAIVWPVGSFFSDERVPGEQTPTTETSSMDGRLSGNLQVRGFDLVQVSQLATLPENLRLAGLTTGDVQLGGTILNPEASGRLAISGLRGTDETRNVAVGPLEFTGTFAADRDSVRLEGGRADSEAGSLTLSGELGGWNAEEGPVVAARFEATDLPLSAYLPTGGAAGLLEGMIDRVSGTVTGPLGEPWPSLRASLAADELRFGRRRATDLRADLGYSHGVAAANRLTCGVAGGRVRLAGASYQPSDDKLFADLALSDLDAQQLLFLVADIASAGRTSEEAAALRDRIYAYGHRVRGRLSAGRVLVGGTPDALEGRAELLTVSRVELDRRSVPGLTAGFRFSGLALREPEGDAPPPSPRDGVPAALAHLRVEGLRAESDPIAGGAILVHGADITRDATIDMAGNMEVVVEADLVPLGAVNDWLPPGLGVGGQLSLTVRATGPVDDPEIEGSLDVLNPTVAGVRFDLLQAANVALSEDSIVMTGGLLKRGLNEVQAEGSLPFDRDRLQLDRKGPVAFRAQVEELPAAVPLDLAEEFTARQPSAGGASTFWGRCQANGLLTAWLTVEGTLGRPEVTGGISIEPGATFRLAGWPSDSTIADISGDVLLGPSPTGVGSTVEAFNLGGRWQETRFTVEGAAEVSRLEPDEWLRNRVDELTLKVTADRQPLPGGTVAKDLRVAAQARTDAEGRHVVTVQEGTARLGRGSATLAGHVIVDTLDPRQFGMLPCDLRLLLDRAQVRYGTLLDRAQVDGAVVARKFASRDGRPLPEWFLAGRGPDDSLDPSAPLRIASATLDSPAERGRLEVTRATLGLPSRERTAGSEETAATPAAGAKKALLGSPAYLPSPRLDLTVGVGHSVDFETVIAKAEVTPDPDALRITGTPQAPEVHGSASLRHGSLRLLRGNLEVPEAGVRVALSPLPYAGAQPPLRRELQMTSEVWGRAEGIVSGTTPTGETIGPIDVELELSGGLPPDHVLVTRSDPPLTSEEVYELLAVGPLAPGGQLASDRSQTVDEMIAGAVASRVFRGVLEPLEEELSETLGLEQFDIRVGLNQPVEFRVGKYLIDNLLVSYSRTAGGPEEEYDLRVSYKLKDRYQVTWHADERQQSAFAVEYRWQF